MTLTVGSLFTGIGGIDLGLEEAGMRVRWQVENDEWCQRVLAKHWPEVERYGDITTLDPSELEPVDVVAGGFPCQPVSLAGKGLAQDDHRWLWPDFARIVRVLRPRYVLVENVPGLMARGFGDVQADLAALGYDTEWHRIPAAEVGAPHERERVWILAYLADPDRGRREGPATLERASGQGEAGHPALDARVADRDGEHEPQEPQGDDLERGERRQRPAQRRREQQPAGTRAGGGARGGHHAEGDVADADRERRRLERTALDVGGSDARGHDADGRSQALADTHGIDGRRRRAGGRVPPPARAGSASAGGVADADRAGQQEQRGPERVEAQQRPAERLGGAMGDAEGESERAGLRSSRPTGVGSGRPRDAGRQDGREEPTQSRVGRDADGLPHRLDGHRWPAPPGPQYEWEPPRTKPKEPGRVARIRGLGNAVVPQIVAGLGCAIVEDAWQRSRR